MAECLTNGGWFQFVPLRDFMQKEAKSTDVARCNKLAKKVLAEIPNQVKMYMKHRGFKPMDVYNAHLLEFPDSKSATKLESLSSLFI